MLCMWLLFVCLCVVMLCVGCRLGSDACCMLFVVSSVLFIFFSFFVVLCVLCVLCAVCKDLKFLKYNNMTA